MKQDFAHGLFVREQRPAVVEDAEGARDVVVYVHGLGESGLCFERLMADRRLGAWRQLAVDLPGYGKSPWPEQPLDFAATVERLIDWMTGLSLPPAIVVGHSMGGVLGADLARRAPDRVRAFVNVEGNISLKDCTFSMDAAGFDFATFVDAGRASLVDDIYGRGMGTETGCEALRGYYASLRMADPRQLHRDSVALVRRSRAETLAAETAAIEAPTRYVLGHPRGAGERSRSLLDEASVRWTAIEDAGHWPYLDQHDVFVDVLVSFLATMLDDESSGRRAERAERSRR